MVASVTGGAAAAAVVVAPEVAARSAKGPGHLLTETQGGSAATTTFGEADWVVAGTLDRGRVIVILYAYRGAGCQTGPGRASSNQILDAIKVGVMVPLVTPSSESAVSCAGALNVGRLKIGLRSPVAGRTIYGPGEKTGAKGVVSGPDEMSLIAQRVTVIGLNWQQADQTAHLLGVRLVSSDSEANPAVIKWQRPSAIPKPGHVVTVG